MNTSGQFKIGLLKGLFWVITPFLFSYLFFEFSNFSFDSIDTQNSKFEIAKFLASISATILGFLLTAIAVLTALMDKTLIENMRRTGHYPKFLRLAFLTSFCFLIVVIIAISILIFAQYEYINQLFSFLIGFLTLALAILLRTGYSFFKIIYNV